MTEPQKLTLGRKKEGSLFDRVVPDSDLVIQLEDMGFDRQLGSAALIATNNGGVQAAVDWILAGGSVEQVFQGDTAGAAPEVHHPQPMDTTEDKRRYLNTIDPTTNPDTDLLRETAKYSGTLKGFSNSEKREFEERQRKRFEEEQKRARKEKQMEILRVRKELELEREERRRRLAQSVTAGPAPSAAPLQPPAPKPATSSSGTTTLQLRLPTGVAKKNTFQSSDTLGTVFAFLENECGLERGTFSLIMNFPRQEFDETTQNQTLLEAGLCPRAQLIVQEVASKGVVSKGEGVYVAPAPAVPPGGFPFPRGPGFVPGVLPGGPGPVPPARPPRYGGDDSDIDSDEDDTVAPPGRYTGDEDDDDEDDDTGFGGRPRGGYGRPLGRN